MWREIGAAIYMFHWAIAEVVDRVHRSLVPGGGREGAPGRPTAMLGG